MARSARTQRAPQAQSRPWRSTAPDENEGRQCPVARVHGDDTVADHSSCRRSAIAAPQVGSKHTAPARCSLESLLRRTVCSAILWANPGTVRPGQNNPYPNQCCYRQSSDLHPLPSQPCHRCQPRTSPRTAMHGLPLPPSSRSEETAAVGLLHCPRAAQPQFGAWLGSSSGANKKPCTPMFLVAGCQLPGSR